MTAKAYKALKTRIYITGGVMLNHADYTSFVQHYKKEHEFTDAHITDEFYVNFIPSREKCYHVYV